MRVDGDGALGPSIVPRHPLPKFTGKKGRTSINVIDSGGHDIAVAAAEQVGRLSAAGAEPAAASCRR